MAAPIFPFFHFDSLNQTYATRDVQKSLKLTYGIVCVIKAYRDDDQSMKDLNHLYNYKAYNTSNSCSKCGFSLSELEYESGISVVGTTGDNGVELTVDNAREGDYYYRGIIDDFSDEWHVMQYADDDWAWKGTSSTRYAASDGKTVLFVVNPKTPAISFEVLNSQAQFYTTPAKAYFMPKIHSQTTYLTDDVEIKLERVPMKKLPATATWYIDGCQLQYSYKAGNKYVENLYIVSKIIEFEAKLILAGEKTVEQFIFDFSENDEVDAERKEARKLLGVEDDSLDFDLMSKKYKQLAKEAHPDMPNGDTERFKELNKAHKILKRELV